MKKMFAVLLSLCLLCGACALADGTTEITNESTTNEAETTVRIEIPASYTVTIPASITIDANTRKGSGEIKIADYPCLSAGKKRLNVYVDTPKGANGAATYMKDSSGHLLYYRMYKDNSTQAIFTKTLLLQVSGGATSTGTSPAKLSTTLNFEIPEGYSDTIYKYAGEYTETLTFIVEEQ